MAETRLKEINSEDVVTRTVRITVVPGEEIRYCPQTKSLLVFIPISGGGIITEEKFKSQFFAQTMGINSFYCEKGSSFLISVNKNSEVPLHMTALEF
jgi:hypothetical protein